MAIAPSWPAGFARLNEQPRLDKAVPKRHTTRMRKTFPLEVSGLKPPRVIEAIKNDLRKYLKRERRKTLPEGVDFWDFDCKSGPSDEAAEVTHVSALITAVDTAAQESWPSVYIEILAKPGHRQPRNE